MKNYNLFCLMIDSSKPFDVRISQQLNIAGMTRRDLFDDLFENQFPNIEKLYNKLFLGHSFEMLTSIDRSFFSPFNMLEYFRLYGFRLGYLKKAYSYLLDKIPIARFEVKSSYFDSSFTYIFFVKEVSL